MKKIVSLAFMTILIGDSLFCMEAQRVEGLLYNLSMLPKELRNKIVSLSLQSQIGWKLELVKRIKAGIEIAVTSVAFSPDGKTVLTGSEDKTARLWDVETGQELKWFIGHEGTIYSGAFSPDGKTVLTGSEDKTARLWDSNTGKELQQFIGHRYEVISVAYSPDGKTVLTGSYDATARLWDIETGKELQQCSGHTEEVSSVAFSPDGKTALTGSVDKTARLWSVETGKELQQFSGHRDWITSGAFSPDGKTFLTGSLDDTARLWDIQTGQELKRFTEHADLISSLKRFAGYTDWNPSIAFSPDGKTVLTSSWDNTAGLWDIFTGEELQRLIEHKEEILSVAFNKDGFVTLGSSDGTVSLWGLNFTLPVKQQQEAWQLFKDKALYAVLSNKAIITEEPKSDSCRGLDESSQKSVLR